MTDKPMGRPIKPQGKSVPRWARRLRKMREAQGWSIRELAGEAGLGEDAVAKWERGKSEPGVFAALALSEALQTTVEELFGR